MTLVESLLAMLILSMIVLSVSYAVTAGHQHLHHSDTRLRAVRLAEHLMEEIQSRPYEGTASTRRSYCLMDYDGFHEAPGELQDCSGTSYGEAHQQFSRAVAISNSELLIGDLESTILTGKIVTIIVADDQEVQWQLSRFIPAPAP